MKTLDLKQSENLFNKIVQLSQNLLDLKGTVQNPSYINQTNAQENYKIFYNAYKNIKKELDEIQEQVYELHAPLITFDFKEILK